MQGWIKLHRKLETWEWADDPYTGYLFIRLMLTANFKEQNYRGVTLMPGQVIFSRRTWSKKTGISERSLRTSLARLEKSGEVTCQSTHHFTVLTIVNWEEYQA